jgi:hypothetical protein
MTPTDFDNASTDLRMDSLWSFFCKCNALAAEKITKCSWLSSHMWGTQHVGILQNGKLTAVRAS